MRFTWNRQKKHEIYTNNWLFKKRTHCFEVAKFIIKCVGFSIRIQVKHIWIKGFIFENHVWYCSAGSKLWRKEYLQEIDNIYNSLYQIIPHILQIERQREKGRGNKNIYIYQRDILPTEKCSEKSTKLLLKLLCYTSRS